MPLSIEKICDHCKSEFSTNRVKAKYCSSRCRTLAWRDRHGIQTRQEHVHSVCQREGCENSIPEDSKATTKYCSNACRQKVWNDSNKDREKAKRDIISKEKKDAKAVEEFIQELMGE